MSTEKDCSPTDTRTIEWLIADLNERIDRGCEYLEEMAQRWPDSADRTRGKADGLALVKDWLRGY